MPTEPETQAGLLSLLERAARHLQPRTTPQEWRQAYEDFRIHLEQITSNPSIIPVMRSAEHHGPHVSKNKTRHDGIKIPYSHRAAGRPKSDMPPIKLRHGSSPRGPMPSQPLPPPGIGASVADRRTIEASGSKSR